MPELPGDSKVLIAEVVTPSRDELVISPPVLLVSSLEVTLETPTIVPLVLWILLKALDSIRLDASGIPVADVGSAVTGRLDRDCVDVKGEVSPALIELVISVL